MDLRILMFFIAFNSYSKASEFQDYSAFADESLQDHAFFEPGDYITSYGSEGMTNSKPKDTRINLTAPDLSAAPFSAEKRSETGGGEEMDNAEAEILENSNYRLRFVPAAVKAPRGKFSVNELTRIHGDSFEDYDKRNLNGEMGSNSAPIRRETNNWQVAEELLENEMPWTYTHPLTQSDYLDYSDRAYLDDPQMGTGKGFKKPGPASELPQYFQKNYYYNYYSAPPVRKYGSPYKWNGEGGITPESAVRNQLGGKRTGKSACKQYLQFLKYAFERLDESVEHQNDYLDDYDVAAQVNGPPRGKGDITTQLMGPMLYVDNSGRLTHNKVGYPPFYPFQTGMFQGPTEPSEKDVFVLPEHLPFGNEMTTPAPSTVAEPTTMISDTDRTSQLPEDESTLGSTTETPQMTTLTNPKYDGLSTASPNRVTSYKGAWPTAYTNTVVDLWAKLRWKQTSGAPGKSSGAGPSRGTTPATTVNSTMANQYYDDFGIPLALSDYDFDSRGKSIDCNDKMLPCPDTVNLTYPLNGYCNRYVSCESGRAIRRICPEGLHFNIITKSCDIPHNSFCTYSCPRPNGYFGVPGDCGGYFMCKNSLPEYRMCPPKMHWDVRKGLCDFEELSSCPMKCLRENEIKPYTGDCRAYIICLRGIPYYHKCPPQMKFDKRVLTCVPEHLSKCENDPRLLTKNLNPSVLCTDTKLQLGSKTWCSYFEFADDTE